MSVNRPQPQKGGQKPQQNDDEDFDRMPGQGRQQEDMKKEKDTSKQRREGNRQQNR